METLQILVVDDEPGMRAGTARALRDFTIHLPDVNGEVRFTVDQAASGEEALAKIRRQPPDILLLDHKLPDISGLDLLAAIAEQAGDVLTIMITAYATLETAVAATKRGAYDFLAKPFTPDELKATIRKAAGRQILARHARRLAQEKRQVRFQFISVLAHELKAPLAAIEGYLHILHDRSAGSDPAVYQRMIDRSILRSEHMRKLISDLLDMTRIESGQAARELVDNDWVELAHAAIETVQPAAAEKNVSIDLAAPPALRRTSDRREIDMMLNNLLTNAVKYNKAGGRVSLTLLDQPGQVTIEVADTGIGMSADEASRLFTDFYRARNERTRDILGSGLGLAIVRKLAQLYGGDVTVRSEPDVGSTFTVVLKT
jgi:signal transduction histidine kinase